MTHYVEPHAHRSRQPQFYQYYPFKHLQVALVVEFCTTKFNYTTLSNHNMQTHIPLKYLY